MSDHAISEILTDSMCVMCIGREADVSAERMKLGHWAKAQHTDRSILTTVASDGITDVNTLQTYICPTYATTAFVFVVEMGAAFCTRTPQR